MVSKLFAVPCQKVLFRQRSIIRDAKESHSVEGLVSNLVRGQAAAYVSGTLRPLSVVNVSSKKLYFHSPTRMSGYRGMKVSLGLSAPGWRFRRRSNFRCSLPRAHQHK